MTKSDGISSPEPGPSPRSQLSRSLAGEHDAHPSNPPPTSDVPPALTVNLGGFDLENSPFYGSPFAVAAAGSPGNVFGTPTGTSGLSVPSALNGSVGSSDNSEGRKSRTPAVQLSPASPRSTSRSISIPSKKAGVRPGTPRPNLSFSLSPQDDGGQRSPVDLGGLTLFSPGSNPSPASSFSSRSPGESSKPLIGSFESSILCGRMSTVGLVAQEEDFMANIAVACEGPSPKQRKVPFCAVYFDHGEDGFPPYTGTIPLGHDKKSMYRVPEYGILQLSLFYPSLAPIHTFCTKFNLRDMPPGTKTVLRYKQIAVNEESPAVLKYALQLRFMRTRSGKIYLYSHIRVVFSLRAQDADTELKSVYEMPSDPCYWPITKDAGSSDRRETF